MTRVRWTPKAADDFAAIIEHIREGNSTAALRVARTIYTAVAELRNFPNRGRKGLALDSRVGLSAMAVHRRIRGRRNAAQRPSHPPCFPGLAIAALGATTIYNCSHAPI